MNKIINFIHNLFVPKEENNYRAKVLHSDFLTYYLLIALFLTFVFKHTGVSNVLGLATDITVNKLYELTNQQREKNGLPDLIYSNKLSAAAYNKAQDMFAKNYWSHYAPDGKTPWDFILSSGYQYEYAGENLAKNFLLSDGVVDAWMKSSTHRDNILRNNYTEVGFAIVNGTLNGEQTTLVVQMLGKPLGASLVKAPVANQPVPAILAKESPKEKFGLLNFSFNMNAAFILFLLTALILDFYFAARLHIIRIGGKNLAHFIFIGFIFLSLLFMTKGAIL